MAKLSVVVATIATLFYGISGAVAQDLSTRFGVGGGVVINPSDSEVSGDDLGFDLRFRISQPLTGAMSLAVGVGSFVFNDEQKTEFVVNPQVLAIATLGGRSRFPYLTAGIGALLPAEQERDSQLEINAGFGWAWPFGASTSAFVELNPLLAIRSEGIAIMVPLRGGLIF